MDHENGRLCSSSTTAKKTTNVRELKTIYMLTGPARKPGLRRPSPAREAQTTKEGCGLGGVIAPAPQRREWSYAPPWCRAESIPAATAYGWPSPGACAQET